MTNGYTITNTDTTCSTWDGSTATSATTNFRCTGIYEPYQPSKPMTMGDIKKFLAESTIKDLKSLLVESMVKDGKCDYCGSRCIDSRGNCGACGAPL